MYIENNIIQLTGSSIPALFQSIFSTVYLKMLDKYIAHTAKELNETKCGKKFAK